MNDLIAQYEVGGRKLRRSVAGLSSQDLLWKPPADAGIGLWSIHQIVIHLMDSELIAIDRMKRIIAEPRPLLVWFDETLFTQNLLYETQPMEDALTMIELGRSMFANVLRKLPEAAFERFGIHTQTGKTTLAEQLQKYCEHLDHHLGFVQKKREWMSSDKR